MLEHGLDADALLDSHGDLILDDEDVPLVVQFLNEASPRGALPEPPPHELTAAERDNVASGVRSLLQTGRASIGQPPRRCEAQIVTFWHGDSILEVRHAAGSIASLTRIPRRPRSQDSDLLFSLLARHVAELPER